MHKEPDLLKYMQLTENERAAFRSYAWCEDIFSNKQLKPIETNFENPKDGIIASYMRKTLSGKNDAILARLSFYKPANTDDPLSAELWTLYSVGSGVDGHEGVSHGGFIATLLDQQMGSAIRVHSEFRIVHTATMNVRFLSPLLTPSAVVCRAWFESVENRKLRLRASLEYKNGAKVASAEALFILASKL